MPDLKLAPGLHEMSAEAYQDLPALNASGARTIVEHCALKYWHDSPLNPDHVPEHKHEFDVGTAAHLAVLEPDRFRDSTVIVEAKKKDGSLAEDYRTDAAQQIRDAAYLAGKTPLFARQVEQVMAIRKAVLAHPVAANAFTDGVAEQTFIWRDPETNIPCKARADWLRSGDRYIANLKTTTNAGPRAFPRTAWGLGYHVSAAWYMDGFKLATGHELEAHWFVAVEREPPHLIAVYQFDERAIEWGRLIYRQALAMLAQCIAKDECPGYREPPYDKDRAFTIALPSFAEYQLQERFEAGEFRAEKPSPELLRRAMAMQAPL
jgi:hypothetical protein